MEERRGRVEVPAEYFLKMAKNDYTEWKKALAREFYQNSIDALASEIDVVSDSVNRTIKIVDNGCGMGQDVLLNKLLVLGGSEKAAGSVGAFGKAKELLFFSWEWYRIRTREWEVTGHGAEFQIRRTEQTRVLGTEVEIKVQPEEDFSAIREAFWSVAQLIQTKTKIRINGHLAACSVYRGTKVVEKSFCNVYQTKCRDVGVARVRVDGIWMFDWWIGHGAGEVVIELTKSSIACLTSNRDHLKGEYRVAVEAMIRAIVIDKKSSLSDKTRDVFETVRGTGKIRVSEDVAVQAIAAKQNKQNETLLGLVQDAQPSQPLAKMRVQDLVENDWTPQEFKDRLKLIGYQPDFSVLHQSEFGKVSRVMSQKQSGIIGRIWTETVKQVLLDNRKYIEFTAGFTFKPDMDAALIRKGDQVFVMVNPLHLGIKACIKSRLFSNRRILMEELKALAIHEVTHLKYQQHDEDFASEMETIRAKTWKSQPVYDQLARMK